MIVNCSECEARFRISDEKLGGRSFKTKCRECGAEIAVRQPFEPPATVEENSGPETAGTPFEDLTQGLASETGAGEEEAPHGSGAPIPEVGDAGSGSGGEHFQYQDILADVATPDEVGKPDGLAEDSGNLQYQDILADVSPADEESEAETAEGEGDALQYESILAHEDSSADEDSEEPRTGEAAGLVYKELAVDMPAQAGERLEDSEAGPGEGMRFEYREIDADASFPGDASEVEPEYGSGVFHEFVDAPGNNGRSMASRKKVSAEEVIAEILETIKQSFPERDHLFRLRIDFRKALTPRYNTPGNRLKMKLFSAVAPILPVLLHPREYVQRIARGYQFSTAELVFGFGVLTRIYNNYAILCTSKRILFCNLSYRNTRTTHYFFEMHYSAIAGIERKFFGRTLVFIGKNGEKRIFQNLKPQLAEELERFVSGKITEPAEGEQPLLIRQLCPACYGALKPGLEYCSSCDVAFKRPMHAVIKSMILPGLGDISLGHHLLGAFELAGGLVVWGFVIKALLLMFIQEQYIPITVELIGLVAYNGLDAVLTWLMAGKGYMVDLP